MWSSSDSKGDAVRVTVAAVAHTQPHADIIALDMPPKVKQHLGLDDARSWIVVDEVNQFDWPGFDLRPVPGRGDKYVYGFMPCKLYEAARTKLLEINATRMKVIQRD